MQCPVDGETLVMSDRNGVEIDYCPKCRGVWLDRGELDKIIDRAGGPAPQPAAGRLGEAPVYQPEPGRPAAYAEPPRRKSHSDDDDDDYRGGHRKKRRESFLGELFDF
jgi:uncharacterized protein